MTTDSSPFQLDKTWPDDLKYIAQLTEQAALGRVGNSLELLALLRLLEQLHQDIRETCFRDALPDNRQRLYALLRDIELHGGWPYIQRMKLLALLEKFDLEPDSGSDASAPESGSLA